MRIRVSDYIADFLVERNIDTVFTVVGGGAMYMNDSFGHHEKLHCIYQHHEQACSMAAEGYAKVNNRMAAVCVTSGPGALNALNGVAGAYADSVPMLVFSGQTKTSLTVRRSGLRLRTLGNQEFDIVSALDSMVKYCDIVMSPDKIRFCLEKAYYMASAGRPGPCWLDVPLDVQGAYVEDDNLEGFCPMHPAEGAAYKQDKMKAAVHETIIRLRRAKRPVIYAGRGIRIAGAYDAFHILVKKTGIPVVTCWDSIDLMETADEMYAGRGGTMGDRAGNFAVQNSDLLLCIGNRLNIYQVGYDVKTWAREAFSIVVDIDEEELKKSTIRADMPVQADAGQFISVMADEWGNMAGNLFHPWVMQCRTWKKKYPVVLKRHYHNKEKVNVYAFMDQLSRRCGEGSITVASNGSASVAGSQSYYIGSGGRFIINCGMSSMGYGLPAAVGACIAGGRQELVCIEGDGSIQMNIQELATICANQLPIKIFVINNGGYHQIRLTQKNIFHNTLVGIGPESGDLMFPELSMLSQAYGIAYMRIQSMQELSEGLEQAFHMHGAVLCEVICDTEQVFEPKSAARRLEDGTLVSPPLEDMAPFLTRDELKENMYINLWEDQ